MSEISRPKKMKLTQQELNEINAAITTTPAIEWFDSVDSDLCVIESEHPVLIGLNAKVSELFLNWVYEMAFQNKLWFFRFSDDGLSMNIMNQIEIVKQPDGSIKCYLVKKEPSLDWFRVDSKSVFNKFTRNENYLTSVQILGKSCLYTYKEAFDEIYTRMQFEWVNSYDYSQFDKSHIDFIKTTLLANIQGKSRGKLSNTMFGMPFSVLAKTAFKAFYGWLDADTLKDAALLSRSFYTDSECYNFAAENKLAIVEIKQIARGLLPIVLWTGQADLKTLKLMLRQKGLTEGGWKWLSKQKRSITAVLMHCYSIHWVCDAANLMAKAGITHPQFFLFAKSLGRYGLIGHHLDQSCFNDEDYLDRVCRLLRVAFEQAELVSKKRGSSIKLFVRDDIGTMTDWLTSGPGLLPSGDFGWKNIMAKQHAWHEEQALIEVAKNPIGWKSLTDTHHYDELEVSVVALNSAQTLVNEGRTMHHCVGSYVERCSRGHSRIFSIRDAQGKDTSTLELTKSGAIWSLGQNRSRYNSNPTANCIKAGENFVKLYNNLWNKLDVDAKKLSLKWFKTDGSDLDDESNNVEFDVDARFAGFLGDVEYQNDGYQVPF